MFNRLPPELARQIIESSVPLTYHSLTYNNRQILLQSLCLVCRLFREIAQPLLFEIVYIDWQWKLDALLTTLKSNSSIGVVWEAVIWDWYKQPLSVRQLERILRSSQVLRSLTIKWDWGKRLDLSVLQNLPHLADLHLSGRDYQFPSCFRLHALTSLSIGHLAIEFAPTLLSPVVLPSLRSLAMFTIHDHGEIAYLNRSRLDQLVPQLESLFLNSRIILVGLDCLIPAYSRTLFDFCPSSSNARIDRLQVPQHLRLHKRLSKEVVQEFVVSIANQDRQTSLRSIYLDIRLKDLSSLRVDLIKAVKDLSRACLEKRIKIIYEEQDTGFAGELRPSEEFSRRQREVRTLEATRFRIVVRGGGWGVNGEKESDLV